MATMCLRGSQWPQLLGISHDPVTPCTRLCGRDEGRVGGGDRTAQRFGCAAAGGSGEGRATRDGGGLCLAGCRLGIGDSADCDFRPARYEFRSPRVATFGSDRDGRRPLPPVHRWTRRPCDHMPPPPDVFFGGGRGPRAGAACLAGGRPLPTCNYGLPGVFLADSVFATLGLASRPRCGAEKQRGVSGASVEWWGGGFDLFLFFFLAVCACGMAVVARLVRRGRQCRHWM